jgi:hypothetical protein
MRYRASFLLLDCVAGISELELVLGIGFNSVLRLEILSAVDGLLNRS